MQREDIAIGLGAFGRDLRGGIFRPTEHPVEPIDQRIELFGCKFIDPAKVRDHLVANLPFVGAVALDELKIAPTAGVRDFRVHAATLPQQ